MPRVILDPSLGIVASAFGVSRRGASHKRSSSPCQDAHLLTDMSIAGYPMFLAAVADGHGSKEHDKSHVGAHLALQATVQSLGWLLLGFSKDVEGPFDGCICGQEPALPLTESEFSDKKKSAHEYIARFENYFSKLVCRTWNDLIRFHDREVSNSEETISGSSLSKRYGTTLLVSALIGDFILLAQIGDGDICLLTEKGELKIPFSFKSDCDLVAGETNSLCSENASKLFKVKTMPRDDILMVALSTDGLRNSYEEDGSFRNLLFKMLENIQFYGVKTATNVLPQNLDHFSAQGSGDDITLAGFYLECPMTSGDQGSGSPDELSMSVDMSKED